MLFSSPVFYLFFLIYFVLHLVLPLKFRLPLIIVGSTIFYSYWNPFYIWLPFAIMWLAFKGAIWMDDSAEPTSRKRRLTFVIILLLLPLLLVKYTNFLYQDVLGALLGFNGPIVNWTLPLGISFITFTLIAYVVDVYTGHYSLEKNPRMLAGLVLFFPHLIAGPILRPNELLPQLHRPNRKIGVRVIFGVAIFSIGLLKKLVFADPMSEAVDRVFDISAVNISAGDYLLAIYGFALQIYCDFSGYTDMAVGAAILLGVKLPTNFQRPYIAASLVEFWTRWHITLSKWLRDYLYIPLGGNKSGYGQQAINLFITMALGGLWHGASWTFVLWGISHGAGISFTHAIRRFRGLQWLGRLPHFIKVLITFHFVAASWILFRSPDLQTAWRVAKGPFLAPWTDFMPFLTQNIFPLVLLTIFFITHRWDDHRTIRTAIKKLPKSLFWPALALIWMLAITVSQGSSAKFIYFDF